MNAPTNLRRRFTSLPKSVQLSLIYSLPFLVVFLSFTGVLMTWEKKSHRDEQIAELIEAGRAFTRQILVEKIWSLRQDKFFRLQDHSRGVPQSTADTSAGTIDFARMTGEMAAIANERRGYRYKLLRPDDIPAGHLDPGEAKGIEQLRDGADEAYGFITIDGSEYFRYLGTLRTDEYGTVPENRSDETEAVSVLIPTTVSNAVHAAKARRNLISIALMGTFSLLFILFLTVQFSRKIGSGIDREIEEKRLKAAVALAGAAAHEMRQPLAIMLGFTEILRDRELRGESAESEIRIIQEQCERMDGIIQRMLTITHYRTKAYANDLEIFDLSQEAASHPESTRTRTEG